MSRIVPFAGVLLLTAWPGWCADQKDKPAAAQKAPAAAPRNFNAKGPKAGGGVPKNNTPRINNPGLPQRLLQMTPEERERALEKLPPDKQAQLRERLARLDALPQRQKDQMARQARGLDSLPLEKRKVVVQQLTAFNKLPKDRILPMRQELTRLIKMPEDQRNARLASDDFKKLYSPEEQSILGDLSQNLPADYLSGR
jgi:hypothetical protein